MSIASKNYIKILCGSFLMGVVISIAGCGKGDSSSTPPPVYGGPVPFPPGGVAGGTVGSCGDGFNTTGLGCVPGNFYSACVNAPAYFAGAPIRTSFTRIGSADVCRTRFRLGSNSLWQSGSQIPALSVPGAQGLSFAGQIFRGDTVGFSSISGGWQQSGCPPFGSIAPTGDIVISDGTQLYAVSNGSKITMNNAGSLRVGFNVPFGITGCWKLNWNHGTVTRCLDAAGNSYACP